LLSGDDDLPGLRQAELECRQHLRDTGRGRSHARCEGRQRALGGAAKILPVRHLRQTEQIERRDRVARWFGAVIVLLDPHYQTVVSRRRAEETTLLTIFESFYLCFRQPDGQIQPLAFELCLVQVEQPLDEECVIVQETWDGRFASPVPPQQCAGVGL